MRTNNPPLPITVIVLTHNEEDRIRLTLSSVHSWASEIFVVDSGSTDRTVDIAREYTDRIVTHAFHDYASQRNWSQEELPLEDEWVFHLDAGERVSAVLAENIHDAFRDNYTDGVDGFFMARRTVFLGAEIRWGGVYPTYHMRLYRRAKGHCEDRLYDQHFVLNGVAEKLTGDLIDDVARDLESWTESHLQWARLEAREIATKASKGNVTLDLFGTPIERRRWLKERLYYRLPLGVRALVYFIVRYLLLLGFLDGRRGAIYHVLQGFWFRFYVDALVFLGGGRKSEPESNERERSCATDKDG